ncbi:tRNA methyltransferase 10 homolog B [Octopus sinensis]|uniref:tRNA methyltransferase 10 homolog B n=1 Tax=Octopus sinensis TaxID=2607531 RepID=A0A6P7TFN4_9MOLL|nr:tRNA methyltransferase 10 homolog B [Octopus sinensis]XP_029650087.1 tRNA methyltransferase 10 homolog B [Octopus sinensis]XP_029650088.1 tRNA methyltransferase 10 homolog B [Octopus sinensis]XP_036368537.1 tRNA methyltransferase 10 homolog B [Octopus sinensis]
MEEFPDELPSLYDSDNETSSTKHKMKKEKREAYWIKTKESKRQTRKIKKQEKKQRAKNRIPDTHSKENGMLNKRDHKRFLHEKGLQALKSGLKICIDLSFEEKMSEKEISRLAQQLGRIYGYNKKTEKPLHIFLTSIDQSGFFFKECTRINQGFQNYLWDVCDESYTELFPKEDIVYLSPDSENVLFTIDPEKVYIIGGLVDESIQKKMTYYKALQSGIQTARLPIDVFMMNGDRKGNYCRILTVNQVLAVISEFLRTEDWRQALSSEVPKRKGLVLKPLENVSS